MAFGWLLLVMAVLVTNIAGVLTAVFLVMLPVNIWWRYMLRRQRGDGYGGDRGSFLAAFVSPIPAAVAEWKAGR
jgi:hypothetical protein